MKLLKYVAVMLVLAYLGFKLVKIPFIGPILQKLYNTLFPPADGSLAPSPVEPEVILQYDADPSGGQPIPAPPVLQPGIDPVRLDWATNSCPALVNKYTSALFDAWGLTEDEDTMISVLTELNDEGRVKLFQYWYEIYRQTKRNAPTLPVFYPSFHGSLALLDDRLSEVPLFVTAYNQLHPTNGIKHV